MCVVTQQKLQNVITKVLLDLLIIGPHVLTKVTNNATLANNYMARADERLREARFIDASENSLGTIESNEFTDARL